MNNWQTEYMAEFHRQDLLEEVEQTKLVDLARQHSRTYRRRMFTQAMLNFANWMISTGKGLRKRYEIPAVQCNQTPSNSMAG